MNVLHSLVWKYIHVVTDKLSTQKASGRDRHFLFETIKNSDIFFMKSEINAEKCEWDKYIFVV